MDRVRFSWIAHRAMAFCSPVGVGRVARAIELMSLWEGSEVVDFGAGKCDWLAAIAAAVPGTRCIGLEPAGLFADEAEKRHAALIKAGGLRVVRMNAADYLKERAAAGLGKPAAALCVGSTHAFGGHEQTLDALTGCVASGGVMVVAEGYWKQPPGAEYLKALGGDESEFTTHAGNLERALRRGLTPLWACTVTDDEWDEYEWAYSRGIESWVRAHPDDPDAEAMLTRSRSWREAYVRWGRDTLGFGVYVLRVPG